MFTTSGFASSSVLAGKMATMNPFDLLGGDDSGDLTQLIASAQQQQVKAEPTKKTAPPPAAKLPSKPLPPAQAGGFFHLLICFSFSARLFYFPWRLLKMIFSLCSLFFFNFGATLRFQSFSVCH